MTSLVIAEHESGKLNGATHKAVNAALQLGAPVDLLVAGENCAEVAKEGACLQGVERVLLCNSPILAQQLAEPMSALILSIAENYGAILAPATVNGKNILPRVAAILDVMQVSDITAIIDPTCFERPIYAGNAVQRLRSHDKKQVITVRITNFESVEEIENAAPIEEISPPQADERVTFKGEALSDAGRPELTSANIVVSGGRALASKEKFDALIIPLADALGGAVGASRAAVDAGYAPNDWQVGQTGKVVAPDLYVACGISGAIQHLAGMKDSKTIVAINKDEEAPIFQVADYGLVADIFDALPQLTQEITRLKS